MGNGSSRDQEDIFENEGKETFVAFIYAMPKDVMNQRFAFVCLTQKELTCPNLHSRSQPLPVQATPSHWPRVIRQGILITHSH